MTTERMVAVLEARFNQYERALARAQGSTNRSFTAIERRGKQLEQRLSQIGQGASLRGLMGPLAAGVSLRGAQQLIDAATRTQNALRVAGLEGDELTRVYNRLFESAQRNAAPIEALVTLYGRMAVAQKDLNATSEELLQFSDLVAMSLRASGQSAAEAQGALLQLGQALGGGKVQAEEYNSLIDGARPLLQAVAAGLEEAGGSVSKLTALVKDGQVSSEAFFRAGQAGADVLRDQLAGAELTVSQAFVRLRNVLEDTAGEINSGSGASRELAEALENLGNWIRDTDFSPLITGVMEFGREVVGVIGEIERLARAAGEAVGADAVGRYMLGTRSDKVEQQRIDSRIAGAFGDTGPADKGPRTVIDVPPPRKTVTLADYPVTGGARAGGDGSGRTREDAFARETRQIRERTAALQAETGAMAGLNPLVDDYGYALEKARAAQDLLSAAEREGLAITPELRASIDTLAAGYASATVEASKLAEAQDRARQRAEEFRDLGKEMVGSFINDLRSGTSAADALANALGRVTDRLLDMALTSIFSPQGGFGGGRGLLGGAIIPGILHKGGVAGSDGYGHGRSVSPAVFAGAPRYHKGGIAGLRPDEVPAILQRGEVVLPKGAVGNSQPQQVHVTVGWSRTADGNLKPFVESVSAQTSGAVVQRATPGIIGASTNAVGQRVMRQPRYLRG